MTTEVAAPPELIARLIEIATPYSHRFGTGNATHDLLAFLASTNMLLLAITFFLCLRLLLRGPGMAEGSGEEHFQDSYLLLRQLRNEMLIEFERLKGETGFLKQDLTEVRSRMEAADCAELQATGESAFSRNARHAQRRLTGT